MSLLPHKQYASVLPFSLGAPKLGVFLGLDPWFFLILGKIVKIKSFGSTPGRTVVAARSRIVTHL